MLINTNEEMKRILALMSETDPSTDKYAALLTRYKTLAAVQLSMEKSEREAVQQSNDAVNREKEFEARERKEAAENEFRNKELEWKIQKDADEYNAKVDFENNKVAMEKNRLDLEYEKLDVEREKIEIEKEKARNNALVESNKAAMDQRRMNLEYDRLGTEREKIEVEKQKVRNEAIEIGSDKLTDVVKVAADILQTGMKVVSQCTVTIIGAKLTLAVAKGILSDEEAGKLHYSKLFSLLKTPNPFSFKF